MNEANCLEQQLVSGRYTTKNLREELCLDVDGDYSQQVASGTISSARNRADWIANLVEIGSNIYAGDVSYKSRSYGALRFDRVEIQARPNADPTQRSAIVKFSRPGASDVTREFKFQSRQYRSVEFEFDTVAGRLGFAASAGTTKVRT